VSRVLGFMGQRIETTRSAHKVGFIREKGKAVPKEG
jgi:hypothetical protein